METNYLKLGGMFEAYCKERGFKFISNNDGFASFFYIKGDECCIQDVFINPDSRESGKASSLVREIESIAKNNGCVLISSRCDLRSPDTTPSIIAHLKYGFKAHSAQNNIIQFFKEL